MGQRAAVHAQAARRLDAHRAIGHGRTGQRHVFAGVYRQATAGPQLRAGVGDGVRASQHLHRARGVYLTRQAQVAPRQQRDAVLGGHHAPRHGSAAVSIARSRRLGGLAGFPADMGAGAGARARARGRARTRTRPRPRTRILAGSSTRDGPLADRRHCRAAHHHQVAPRLHAHVLIRSQQVRRQGEILAGRHAQGASRAQAALRPDRRVATGLHAQGRARADSALNGGIARGSERDGPARLRRALHGQVAAAIQAQIAGRLRGAARRDAHVARGSELQVARQRHQIAADIHAHPGLGADQAHAVGVHAAQRRGVQGELGRRALPSLG
ncbi:hypothetical protein LMG6003_00003 [Achromobacter insolitus]|nr:hypothetical protein LMG6003_00003 [Achromobacter insolitus]